MKVENISVRPAENGFIVDVSGREEGKGKRDHDSYTEKRHIAKTEEEAIGIMTRAMGKGEKKKKGRKVKSGRGKENRAKVSGSPSMKRPTFKR
jgi:hypothetical protein